MSANHYLKTQRPTAGMIDIIILLTLVATVGLAAFTLDLLLHHSSAAEFENRWDTHVSRYLSQAVQGACTFRSELKDLPPPGGTFWGAAPIAAVLEDQLTEIASSVSLILDHGTLPPDTDLSIYSCAFVLVPTFSTGYTVEKVDCRYKNGRAASPSGFDEQIYVVNKAIVANPASPEQVAVFVLVAERGLPEGSSLINVLSVATNPCAAVDPPLARGFTP